jgi:hypothetical protein
MKNFLLILLLLIIMVNSGCDYNSGSSLTVIVKNIEEDARIDIYLVPVVYHPDVNNKYSASGKSETPITINKIQAEMYALWITSPGYVELKYHLAIPEEAKISLTTTPGKYAITKADGFPVAVLKDETENRFMFDMALNEERQLYEIELGENKYNGLQYYFEFKDSHKRFYDPKADSLVFFPGQKPAYISVLDKNQKRLSIDLNIYGEANLKLLPKPLVTGLNIQPFYAFDRTIDQYSPAIDLLMHERITLLADSTTPAKELSTRIFAYREKMTSPPIEAFFKDLNDLKLLYPNELTDLILLEQAKIFVLFGNMAEAHKLMSELNPEGFAGMESIRFRSQKYNRLKAGYSSWLEKS